MTVRPVFREAGPCYIAGHWAGRKQAAVMLAGVSAQRCKNFYPGLEMSLAGMLESPQFLFRARSAKRIRNMPAGIGWTATARRRSSVFPVEAGPDPKLWRQRKAAGRHRVGPRRRGRPDDQSPRVEAGMRAFFADLLQFDLSSRWRRTRRSSRNGPSRSARDAEEQTLRTIVDLLLTHNGDYRDLFTTRRTFLTPLLGSIYRVPLAGSPARWQPYEFAPGDPRAGIQSQAELRRAAFARRFEFADVARQGAARAVVVRAHTRPAGERQFRRGPGHA